MSSSEIDEVSIGTVFDRKPQTLFVYVKIPVKPNARPDPFHQRENELARLLQEAGTGSVIGWGQSFSDAGDDGFQRLLHQRIDITTTDIGTARSTLRMMLVMLGIPSGTEIHYTQAGRSLMDVYTRSAWHLDQEVV